MFLIMSDTDTTFNFVIATSDHSFSIRFADKADDEYGGRLPVHAPAIADEFANIGNIIVRQANRNHPKQEKSLLLLFCSHRAS